VQKGNKVFQNHSKRGNVQHEADDFYEKTESLEQVRYIMSFKQEFKNE
jgi:hypothetical protein